MLIDGGQLLHELVADLLLLGDGSSLRRGDALELLGVVGAQLGQIGAEPPAVDRPADGDTDQQGEQRQTQGGEAHASTSRPAFHSARRSAWPWVPPLILRVINSKRPASASSLSSCRDQYQAADSAAHSGISSMSG